MSAVKSVYSAETIATRVSELARKIEQDYAGKKLVAICVLKGSFIFFSDLVRNLNLDVRCEFLALNEYDEPSQVSGEVKIILDIEDPLQGCDLLLVDDLVDTGITLRFLKESLLARKPASLKTCALLWKKGGVEASLIPDYIGFEVDRSFFVGYGIDNDGLHRELPYIGTLERRP